MCAAMSPKTAMERATATATSSAASAHGPTLAGASPVSVLKKAAMIRPLAWGARPKIISRNTMRARNNQG